MPTTRARLAGNTVDKRHAPIAPTIVNPTTVIVINRLIRNNATTLSADKTAKPVGFGAVCPNDRASKLDRYVVKRSDGLVG